MTRPKILARIRALQAKTLENGCTEAEALAAAQLASTLMEEYQVDLTELEVEQEGVELVAVQANYGKSMHEVDFACVAIGQFCDCRVWRSKTKEGFMAVQYLGMRSDVEMARWLTMTIRSTMDREFETYWFDEGLRSTSNSVSARKSFMRGMASRVSERLHEIRAARKQAVVTSGKELMVIKNTLVEQRLKAMGQKPSFGAQGKASRYHNRERSAGEAGRAAGDRVGFAPPINAPGSTKAISNK